MTVTSIDTDFDNLAVVVIADFNAPMERVWKLWSDPRQLERWWGPPTHPGTVVEHDLSPGGSVTYYMTGPDGEKYHGWWKVISVDPPTSLTFTDGFADQDGNPLTDMPTSTMRMQLSEREGGTHMEMRATYDSRENLDKVLAMGMLEGIRLSAGQMDALLVA
jgi:uncharacterized protein YndB with AHSA1/START domain